MKTAIIFVGFLLTAMFFGLSFSDWQDIPVSLGGITLGLDDQGYHCFEFKVDNQVVCFEERDTWYGRDAVPKYVIENGVRTPLF